jgi:hypothetical protein
MELADSGQQNQLLNQLLLTIGWINQLIMYHVLLQQDASSTAPTLLDPLSPDYPSLTRKGTKNLRLF